MLNVKIFPHNIGSEGARALARGLDVLRIRKDGNFVARTGTTIINWGNQIFPKWRVSRRGGNLTVLNKPEAVARAINKIAAFQAFEAAGVSIPKYTLTQQEARGFLDNDGIVVCRTIVSGHAGKGIVVARKEEEIVAAPLYTKHIRHKEEYRVHVVRGQVIDYAQKKKRNGTDPDILVRSHGNWIFSREGVTLPPDAITQAIAAVKALGLDFGAVDIGYRVKESKAFVFEVNTAPGFEYGTTTQRSYTRVFKELLGV
jgi:glutathione synthase/RimK-type ligase-like ATP-grasp enzyme